MAIHGWLPAAILIRVGLEGIMQLSDKTHHRDIFSLSGWLYADLLLGLAILFLVIGADQYPTFLKGMMPAPTSTPTMTPTGLFTPTPYPTYTPFPDTARQPTATYYPTYTPYPDALPTAQIGLESKPFIVYIMPDQKIKNKLAAELRRYEGRQAGFVLIFGYHPFTGSGVDLARQAEKEIKRLFPEVFPETMPTRPLFWNPDESGEKGTIRLEIFFISKIESAP